MKTLIHESVDLVGFLAKIEAYAKNNRSHIVDITRIIFLRITKRLVKKTLNQRTHIFFIGLLVSLLCCPESSMAQDVIIGHVVSVDRERGEFILQTTDTQEDSSEFITVRKSTDEKILFLPECVEPGNFVRIWGKLSESSSAVFQADIVRGPGFGNRDSSGIRSRLNRGVGRQYGRQNNRLHKKR